MNYVNIQYVNEMSRSRQLYFCDETNRYVCFLFINHLRVFPELHM